MIKAPQLRLILSFVFFVSIGHFCFNAQAMEQKQPPDFLDNNPFGQGCYLGNGHYGGILLENNRHQNQSSLLELKNNFSEICKKCSSSIETLLSRWQAASTKKSPEQPSQQHQNWVDFFSPTSGSANKNTDGNQLLEKDPKGEHLASALRAMTIGNVQHIVNNNEFFKELPCESPIKLDLRVK